MELQNQKQRVVQSVEEKSVRGSNLMEVDNNIASALMKKQRENFERELNELRVCKNKGGKAAATFELKKKILGGKAIEAEAVAVVDPSMGVEVTVPSQIRHASLSYCKKLLTNRKPAPGYEVDLEVKHVLHKLRMSESFPDEMHELTEEHFMKTYNILAKTKSEKYEFIFNAGSSLKPALFNLCKTAWKTEILPENWSKATLIQLYKEKVVELL